MNILETGCVFPHKSPCGAEGEEKARYPQGHEDAILYHSFSFKEPAGKCHAETAENNDRRQRNNGG